jgi:F-type H+-transporting ATPase subunit delta
LSKNKNFSDTSVGRYSLALYELSEEDKNIEEIENNSLSLMKLITGSKELSDIIKDPTNKREDLYILVKKISEIYNLNQLLIKFLNFLVLKRRFFFVEKILNDFIETCSKKRGEVTATLTSAKELKNDEINKIKDDLTKYSSSKIKLMYKHEPNLIAGLIIQIGSTMIDTSIRTRLQKIQNKMIGV